MDNRKFTVVVHKAGEGGYWTFVPVLAGAAREGDTVEEVLAMAREAIELMSEGLTEDGKPIPDHVDPISQSTR